MSIRVLVVENERAIADSLVMILRRHGYETQVAYTADDAVQLATGFRPHAVVSDVLMPGMSGIELARFVWKNLSDCKVLLVSGDGELIKLMDRLLMHMHHAKVLTKPVDPQTVLAFLAECEKAAEAQS